MFLKHRIQVRALGALFMIFTFAPSIPVAADEPASESTSVSSLYIGSNSGGEANADIHHLSGPDARRQLIVTATLTDGQVGDFSRRVKYEICRIIDAPFPRCVATVVRVSLTPARP